MIDLSAAYSETQRSLASLVRTLDPGGLATRVPSTPDWSVKDVVGHLTGVAGDAAGGRFNPALDVSEAWRDPEQAAMRDATTARQVQDRRPVPIEEVLAEWDGYTERLLPMIRGEQPFPLPMPFTEHIVVTDLAVHAQDIRNALGWPGDRESAGVGAALGAYAAGVDLRLRTLGLPALRLTYGGKHRVLGEGEPAATLEGDRYELFRALAGRRSRDQILAMTWTGDPRPYLPHIPAYGERLDPLVE